MYASKFFKAKNRALFEHTKSIFSLCKSGICVTKYVYASANSATYPKLLQISAECFPLRESGQNPLNIYMLLNSLLKG